MPPFFDVHGDPAMDPYTILGLPPTASEAEIKRSYRMQMLQLHPDKLSPTLSEGSIAAVSEKFHNVKDAYEFLVSPLHLASRRLYMAKVASRRADYERREAYLRRNGGGGSAAGAGAGAGAGGGDSYYSSSTGGVPRGYAHGGGGAAGMAGAGFTASTNACDAPAEASGRAGRGTNGNSYAVPPSRRKTDSENEWENREKDGGRRSSGVGGGGGGVGQPRYYTNSGGQRQHSSNGGGGKTTGRSGQDHRTRRKENRGSATVGADRNGYKSDSHVRKSKSFHEEGVRGGAKTEKRSGCMDGKEKRQYGGPRGKSEEPPERRERYAEGTRDGPSKRTTARDRMPSRSNNPHTTARDRFGDAREHADRERREGRTRARSAPARYADDDRRRDGNTRRDKHYPVNAAAGSSSDNLPKEFFCPLTKKLMKDPVRDDEGNVYEREAIERWLRVQSSSPITNRYLSPDMIRPDKELKRAIYKATGEYGEGDQIQICRLQKREDLALTIPTPPP